MYVELLLALQQWMQSSTSERQGQGENTEYPIALLQNISTLHVEFFWVVTSCSFVVGIPKFPRVMLSPSSE
jgi:hypothetical protein